MLIYELLVSIIGDLTIEKFEKMLIAIGIWFGIWFLADLSRKADIRVGMYYKDKYRRLREGESRDL